jgi:hypothetical protein
MQRNEMKNSTLMVATTGATLSGVSPDGEILWTEGLVIGRHRVSQWLPFLGPKDTLTVDGDATMLSPTVTRLKSMPYGEGSRNSGANPDFQVTSASRHERELGLMMKRMASNSDKLEKRLAYLNSAADKAALLSVPANPVIDEGDAPEIEIEGKTDADAAS